MKKALLKTLCIGTLLSLTFSITSFAGEWKKYAGSWWYQNDDGTNPANKWQEIDGTWYFFKPDGYMNTGWIKVDNQWYYCETTGEMRTADLETDVMTFKFNADGSCSNFYDNVIPSTQAGWANYGSGSISTLSSDIANGYVVYYNGSYWATPDFVSMNKNETVIYLNSQSDVEEIDRFGLAGMVIE